MITIRHAREDEAALLAVIGFRAWEKAGESIGLGLTLRDNARSAFENFTRSAWLSIVVAELDGTRAGWAAREHFDGKITDFWVDPDFQRRGVGTVLLAEVERQINDTDFERAQLESHAQNEQAVAFFKRHGYSVNWLSVTYSAKLDRDVQSIGLSKFLNPEQQDTYGPGF